MYSSNLIVLEIRDISDHQRLALLDLAAFAKQRKLVPKREIERAGTLFLLSHLLGSDEFSLAYTVNGKPFLMNRPERISISHSHDVLCVMCSRREETGVDVELLREKVLNIRHKFMCEEELAFAGRDIEKHITIWAAKEAMYKAYGEKQVDFKNHMRVQPFSGSELKGTLAEAEATHHYRLKREILGDYILVYVLHEVPVGHSQA